ncbi:MAG: beta-CASP ribonuclease aCPSF1, partial [Thermoplasmata archaeon]|nr:beta-CASP ribonuclease aCPSF1 [Thermoplasmata archaeon]
MGIEKILEDAREAVKKTIPSNIEVTDVDFEGPVIVIYTKNLEEFAHNNDLVRQLAQSLRRRVAIRPDPTMLANTESAEERIRKIIPEEAKITNIYFDDDTGEVTIEAISPGLVIGKHGAVLNEIKKEIGWAPKVVRAPPIPSKTVSEIRNYLRKNQDERKEFLRKVGKRLMRQRATDETWLRITSLGGYREVGRSASLLMTRESKVLIDCGVAVSADNGGSTPYLSAPELMPMDS